MTIQEIQNKILTDDTFVHSELEQLLVYYNLKHTLRWGFDNKTRDIIESVAEHVYGMHILLDYFLPLHPEVNAERARELTTWHDMAEAIVDDMTTRTKTEAHRLAEQEAERELIAKAPAHLQNKLSAIFEEYEKRETTEARFVKAVDKIEPVLYLVFISDKIEFPKDKQIKQNSDAIVVRYDQDRQKYIADYPILKRFSDYSLQITLDSPYIHPEA